METYSKERAKKRKQEGQDIRKTDISGCRGEESESGTESERWRERGGPGGGAEHHVIVPWKFWGSTEEIEREETRAGQF